MNDDEKRKAARDVAELVLEEVDHDLVWGRAFFGASDEDIDDIHALIAGARVVIE